MAMDALTRRWNSTPGDLTVDPLAARFERTTTDDAIGGVGRLLGLPFELIGHVVKETGRDLEGALRTGVAFGGSLANLLGSSVPYTLQDLESRDIRGTVMLGALLASGGVSHLAKGIPALSKLAHAAEAAKLTRLTAGNRLAGTIPRMALTGGTEVLAGATFGLLRPLESDEDRIKAVLGDAALFGGIGAGASLMKTSFMATLGIPMIKMGKGIRAQMTVGAIEAVEKGNKIQEMVGLRLRNPKTKAEATIYRHSENPLEYSIIHHAPKGSAKAGFEVGTKGTLQEGQNLKGPLDKLATEGFIEPMGPAGINPFSREIPWTEETLPELVPKEWIDLIKQQEPLGGPKLEDLLKGIKMQEYQSVREAARAFSMAEGVEANFMTEYLTDSVTELGVFKFSDKGLKKDVINYLPNLSTDQRRKLLASQHSDPEILRLAMQSGIANVETVKHGMHVRDWVRELVYNDLAPQGMSISIIPNSDLFAKWFMTTRTIAKIHPEIMPLFESMTGFERIKKESNLKLQQEIFEFKEALEPFGKYEMASGNAAKAILDEGEDYAYAQLKRGFFDTKSPHLVDDMNNMARMHSKEKAANPEAVERMVKSLGIEGNVNPNHVGLIVNQMADGMDVAGQMLVDINRLDKTRLRPGFFTIMNNLAGNKWRASLTLKNGRGESLGWFATREEAEKAAASKMAERPEIYKTAFAQADDAAMPLESLLPLHRGDTKKLLEKIGEDTLYDIRSPMLYERKLGIRDLENSDIYDIYEAYMRSANRAKALHDSGFSEVGRLVSDSISGTKPILKSWVDNRISLIAGQPTKQEIAVQNFVEKFGRSVGYEFKPQALKRWTIGLRQWESFSRLFGLNSPLVNMTQIAINTYPKIGAKYTLLAMKDVLQLGERGKFNRDKFRKMMHEFDAGLDHIVPFADAKGGLSGELSRMSSQTFGGLIKRKEYGEVVNRAAMFMFNGVEEMNRIITWHGAYMKSMAEQEAKKVPHKLAHQIAGTFATKTMFETQFDYSMANMPEVLTTPIGALLGQFKSFFINEIEFIAQMTPKEQRRFAVAMQALGGSAALFSIPGPDLLSSAKGMFFDTTLEEDFKLEKAVPELQNNFPALSRFTSFGFPGLPGEFPLGTSFSDYVGIGGFGELSRGLLGPFGSDMKALKDFVYSAFIDKGVDGGLKEETYNRFLQKTMPSQFRRILTMTRILESGEVRDSYSGKLIYHPDNRLEEALRAGVGPPSVEMQQERVMDQAVNRIRNRYNSTRASFAKDAARAMIEGRRQDATTIMDKARAQGYEVSGQSLNYWVKELQTTAAERRYRSTPVALRTSEELREYFEINGILPEEVERAIGLRGEQRSRRRQGLPQIF